VRQAAAKPRWKLSISIDGTATAHARTNYGQLPPGLKKIDRSREKQQNQRGGVNEKLGEAAFTVECGIGGGDRFLPLTFR